ncbi:MAG: 3-phosphoshikimate 1-carboxyvinyltransferase [Verrucomicrobiota bacterium]
MKSLKVKPIRSFHTEVLVPGDKSISHRAAILGGMASGTTRVTGFLNSEDCLCTMSIMEALGVKVDRLSETSYIIEGRAGKLLRAAEALDCGNSGTSMRLLAGLLAGQPFTSVLVGDASLSRRPMKRIVEPLEKMGAAVVCEGKDFRPPLKIEGKSLKGISYRTPVPSAQVKSCILLAGLNAEGKTEVKEDFASRDHTERMLKHFQASITCENHTATLRGGHKLQANDVDVPGDISSAAFWLVAAAAFPGAKLTLHKVGLNPTRTGVLNVLTRMGARISEEVFDTGVEPMGNLFIHNGGHLKGTQIGGAEIPNVIDELPILAVAGALAEGTTIIRDAKELRVKETDRIAALASNLRAFGVNATEQPDGLIIEGKGNKKLKGARVQSYGDHRIAMAFAILGLFCKGETLIDDTACIATSYPTFERDIALAIKNQ